MKNFVKNFGIFAVCFLFIGCAAQKVYVPTQTVSKIEYRDTTILIKDTVYVSLPTEKVESKTPDIEPSHLETSVATSDAWVEGDKLHHTLKNKTEQLKTEIDTLVTVQYIDRYIEKPIIQEVEVEKPYIPKWAWGCIGWTILCAGWFLAKIWMKFK